MKKYRLIKYDVTGRRIEHGTESFSTLEEAAKQMLERSEITFRIEEIEESIMNRVKSYGDALKVLGEKSINPVSGCYGIEIFGTDDSCRLADNRVRHIVALLKLETITAALNEGWKPDWEDAEQKKYRVQYGAKADKCYCVCEDCMSNTPSRLYFKYRELAEYAAKQFAELYKQLLIEKF